MSVYVDEMQDYGRCIGRAGPLWCHMIADTLGELHEMAGRIGLRRAWFQGDSIMSMPHYDIGTASKRTLAVRLGAIERSRRVFVGHMRRIRCAREVIGG